jgi:cell division protein FtsN
VRLFKGAEQAETVRAQLAFEGFASHITTNNGWNRVVIGRQRQRSATSRYDAA